MRRLSSHGVEGSRRWTGREFQDAGPDEQKARGPSVTVDVLGSINCRSSAERSRERPEMAVSGTQAHDRYSGALLQR